MPNNHYLKDPPSKQEGPHPPNLDWHPTELLNLVEALKNAFALDLNKHQPIHLQPRRVKRNPMTSRKNRASKRKLLSSSEEEKTTEQKQEDDSNLPSSSLSEVGAAGKNLSPPPQC